MKPQMLTNFMLNFAPLYWTFIMFYEGKQQIMQLKDYYDFSCTFEIFSLFNIIHVWGLNCCLISS